MLDLARKDDNFEFDEIVDTHVLLEVEIEFYLVSIFVDFVVL